MLGPAGAQGREELAAVAAWLQAGWAGKEVVAALVVAARAAEGPQAGPQVQAEGQAAIVIQVGCRVAAALVVAEVAAAARGGWAAVELAELARGQAPAIQLLRPTAAGRRVGRRRWMRAKVTDGKPLCYRHSRVRNDAIPTWSSKAPSAR